MSRDLLSAGFNAEEVVVVTVSSTSFDAQICTCPAELGQLSVAGVVVVTAKVLVALRDAVGDSAIGLQSIEAFMQRASGRIVEDPNGGVTKACFK